MAAFLFDLDGTLADSRRCLLQSIDFSLEAVGLKDLPYDPIEATQQDLATTLRQAMEGQGQRWDDRVYRGFVQHFRDFHEHQGEACISLYPGVRQALEALRPHFRLGVATTKDSKQAVRVIQKLGLTEYFDHVQGTDPGLRYKPAPDILLRSLEILEKKPVHSFYMGDSRHDIRAARAGGLRALGAAYGFSGEQGFFKEQPDWLLQSPVELVDLVSELASGPAAKTV